MKISPMKDYKKPKYAVGIAALVAMTASATGCVQNAGAAMTYETTSGYSETELAGTADTLEETSCTDKECPVTTENTNADTTKLIETDEPQLDGYLVVPEETTAVAGTGSIFSVAVNALKKIFDTESPKLEGDVPLVTDDDIELAGEAEITEDEIIELAGDVEAPMDDTDDINFAREYAGEFYESFRNNAKGEISVNTFSGSESPIDVDNVTVHFTYASVPKKNADGIDEGVSLDISFVEKDSELWKKISSESGWDKVYGGYISSAPMINESKENKYRYETKQLMIGVDDYYTELTAEFCDAVVSDLLAKGVVE